MKTNRLQIVVMFWLSGLALLGQTGISGSATITVQDAGVDCLGMSRVVEIGVDVTGLTGTAGEDAALNAFCLSFDLDKTGVFASAVRGIDSDFEWGFVCTEKSLVTLTSKVTVVGWVAWPQDPTHQNYHVATIRFSGTPQDVTLTFDPATSSLGSRVVRLPDGDGPGPIDFNTPSPLTVTIPTAFSASLGDGLAAWLTLDPDYDFAPPTGAVDILDLVKLVSCGG